MESLTQMVVSSAEMSDTFVDQCWVFSLLKVSSIFFHGGVGRPFVSLEMFI